MALPTGITTCTVTVGPAYSYSGEEGVITGSVVADRNIVWSATGSPVLKVESMVTPSLSGGQTSFAVPHVDQPGFVDAAGAAIAGWYYTFNGRATFAGNRVETISKRFQVFSGQATVDLDLVPDGPVTPGVTVPAQYVTSVNGQTGAVELETGGGAVESVTPLPKFTKALSSTRARLGHTKILVIGDSTSGGYDQGPTTSWPAHLAPQANRAWLPTGAGFAIPHNGTGPDQRVTRGSGWANEAGFGFAGSSVFRGTSGGSGALTFAPGVPCDTFDVYYMVLGSGTFTAAATGGAPSTVATGGGSGLAGTNIRKATVSAGSLSSTNVLTINGVTGGDTYIVSVEGYDSRPGVRILNASQGGSTTGTWTSDNNLWGSIGSVKAHQPDLSVIMLGINDAQTGVSEATFETNLRALIAAAQVSGDVLLSNVVPSVGASGVAEQGYDLNVIRPVAAELGCAFLDMAAFFGTYEAANAAGYMTDGLHPSPAGYGAMSKVVLDAVTVY